MPWIDTSMITLPDFPPRRCWLLGFWITATTIFSVLTGLLLGQLLPGAWFFLGPAAGLSLALWGAARPRIVQLPYRAWNRLARSFAHYAFLYVCWVCFFLFVFPVGRTGSALRLARPASRQSNWVARGSLRSQASFLTFDPGVSASAPGGSWVRDYVLWARVTGNLWALLLLPLLVLLAWLEPKGEKELPANIYTLF